MRRRAPPRSDLAFIRVSSISAAMQWLPMLATLVFVVSAAVQVNDPDALPWILVYMIAAGIAAASASGHRNPIVIAFGLLACLAPALPLLPSLAAAEVSSFTNIGMANLRDEQARESLGLLIAAVWMGYLLAFTLRGEERSRR